MALESYWPEYLRELREFRALAGAEEPELTAAGAALRRAPDDFYTATLTDAGCAGGSACWGSRWSTAETWPSAASAS